MLVDFLKARGAELNLHDLNVDLIYQLTICDGKTLKINNKLKMCSATGFADLLREIYKDAYLQGREDGLEGLHIEPQLMFDSYVADEKIAEKISELGHFPTGVMGVNAVDLH